MVQIAIADDHRLFRETLGEVLGAHAPFKIIALCGNSDELLEMLPSRKPDLILMDIHMKPLSGVAATQAIRQVSSVSVIGLSMYSLPAYAIKMFSAGANGYITKNSPLDEIFKGIDAVMKNKKFLCKDVRELMVAEELEPEPEQQSPNIGMLTPGEIEVAQLISKGLSSKEIAMTLNCTCKTIEVRRQHMLKKLHLKNTNEMVNFLYTLLPDFI